MPLPSLIFFSTLKIIWAESKLSLPEDILFGHKSENGEV